MESRITKEDFACYDNSLVMFYPHKIDAAKYLERVNNNDNEFTDVAIPALINKGNKKHFESAMSFSKGDKQGELLIYSPDEKRRVVVTTILVDYQKHYELLENMISYVTRGWPNAVLLPGEETHKTWKDTEKYLREADIHYYHSRPDNLADVEIRKRAYYMLVCNKTTLEKALEEKNRDTLPLKTSLNFWLESQHVADKQNGNFNDIIVDIPQTSMIQRWTLLGLEWLKYQLMDESKYSLDTVEQVCLLMKSIEMECPQYIKELIVQYLKKHNVNKSNSEIYYSFDMLPESTHTHIAKTICEYLKVDDIKFNTDNSDDIREKEIIVNEPVDPKYVSLSCLANYILATKIEKVPDWLRVKITARFVATRNSELACWDNDVFTTAIILRALLKLEKDAKNENIDFQINLIASCYDSGKKLGLSKALSQSLDIARSNEYETRKVNQELRFKNAKLEDEKKVLEEETQILKNVKSEYDKIKYRKHDYDNLKNHAIMRRILIATLGFMTFAILAEFVLFIYSMASKFATTPEKTVEYRDAVVLFFTGGMGSVPAIVFSLGTMVVVAMGINVVKRKFFDTEKEDIKTERT